MDFSLKKDAHTEFASRLLFARDQIHILHLQTQSYAQHIALNELYDSLLGSFDSFVETMQGKLSKIFTGYKTYPYVNLTPIEFVTAFKSEVQSYREKNLKGIEYSNIDNQLQVVIDSLEVAIYKLKFLK